jgi:uncharacterized membrane protein
MLSQTSRFEGSIPHPEIFRQYGEIIPDAPERILRVFEQDSDQARNIQTAALNVQKDDDRRSQWMAWSLILTGYCMSGIFAYFDKDTLSGIILATTLAGTIASVFQSRPKPEDNDTKK